MMIGGSCLYYGIDLDNKPRYPTMGLVSKNIGNKEGQRLLMGFEPLKNEGPDDFFSFPGVDARDRLAEW